MSMYTNPIYDRYFADPFILSYENAFYAYGTAPGSEDGKQFPILTSEDLIHWQQCGWALESIKGLSSYWAPEVIQFDGQFYLYYSAGIGDKGHQLRVATSERPDAQFVDSGHILTPDLSFAIDAHPFQDVDGQWYLFYARDFLESQGDYRIGTGIVVDRLNDMFTLAGDPKSVIRPYADWHLFQANRPMYNGVYDWHTIEGPSLRMHNGRYYCFYSGGAWERENYGVSYVVADHPLGPYTRPPYLDGAMFHSISGRVYGPGHNSFVRDHAGNEYIVYHAWNEGRTARLMCLDRLTWEDERPVLHGPTWTPQPVPIINEKG